LISSLDLLIFSFWVKCCSSLLWSTFGRVVVGVCTWSTFGRVVVSVCTWSAFGRAMCLRVNVATMLRVRQWKRGSWSNSIFQIWKQQRRVSGLMHYSNEGFWESLQRMVAWEDSHTNQSWFWNRCCC